MNIAVASSDDIVALYAAYNRMVDGGQDETLDVTFAPGVYGVASIGPIQLDLGGTPELGRPTVDVTLRGAAGDAPVVFHDMGMLVTARSLRLENLILTGRKQNVLDARVARALVIKNCIIADNEWSASWSGALLKVGGVHGGPAYTVDIDDTWFVRNTAQSPAALLAVVPATGSYVDAVTLRRAGFAANTLHGDLVIHEARAVHGQGLVVMKDCHDGAVFLRYARCGELAIDHSTFVLDDPGSMTSEDRRTWRADLALNQTTMYVASGARALPGGVSGTAEIVDRARLTPRPGALDAAITAILSGGSSATSPGARLRDALGIE